MDEATAVRKARRATLLMFLICGISVSAWAPMVPIVKQKIGINEAELGTILLAMGAGAIIVMPFIGPVIQKKGSRIVIILSSVVAAITLPILTLVNSPYTLGAALFVFGGSMGSLDVSMNSQAVVVQEKMNKPVMSSFHGMFSVGGLIGALAFGFLLMLKLSAPVAACIISLVLLIIVFTNFNSFLPHNNNKEESAFVFRLPKGPVIVLGVFCFIVFLAEGAMLDWSALFLQAHRNFPISTAGVGYAVFSVAMALMRFTGDRLVHYFGPRKIVFWGATLASIGLLIAVFSPWQIITLSGFLLIGIGAANIVPVIFSSAGKADPASPELALAAVTTLGYAGQLAGPALIGFAAHYSTLPVALGLLAAPLFLVAISFNRRDPVI